LATLQLAAVASGVAGLMKAGDLARRQLGEGRARALAAFVKRPQAAVLKSALCLFYERPAKAVNEKIFVVSAHKNGNIFQRARAPAERLRSPVVAHAPPPVTGGVPSGIPVKPC
jgi:hypothetical protein